MIENVVVVTPHVQMLSRDAACVSYIRVLQILDMYVMDHICASHDPDHIIGQGATPQSHILTQ